MSGEVEQELGGGHEEHGVTGEHGLIGDVARDHGLAESLRRDLHDVAATVEELEAERRRDGVAVDALGPVPLVVGHRLEAADTAACESALEALLRAALALVFDEDLDCLERPEPPLGGGAGRGW